MALLAPVRSFAEGRNEYGPILKTASSLCAWVRSWARMRAKQNAEFERFCDVIVGAGFEPQDLIGFAVVAGEHDDRAAHAGLAHQAADFAAVEIGQADVEDDEVGQFGLGLFKPRGAGGRVANDEFRLQIELFLQRFAERVVVVDEENTAGRGHI